MYICSNRDGILKALYKELLEAVWDDLGVAWKRRKRAFKRRQDRRKRLQTTLYTAPCKFHHGWNKYTWDVSRAAYDMKTFLWLISTPSGFCLQNAIETSNFVSFIHLFLFQFFLFVDQIFSLFQTTFGCVIEVWWFKLKYFKFL